MPVPQSNPWFHINRYPAEATCEFCNAAFRHEFWCITRNPWAMNAWQAVLDAAELNLHDHLFLHALGVSWKDASAKRCKLSPQPI